ncbi:hypothetical protein QN277_020638 [Acacia crassicarpa]|uniref:Uncharacterized protein n=1 Tax=Acacia crassicarpa TaxID=499986 RepID=A0AAE1ML84_9FABA|nr:hypothetical protein QN277_020638 [Acacia crassicarpa]
MMNQEDPGDTSLDQDDDDDDDKETKYRLDPKVCKCKDT